MSMANMTRRKILTRRWTDLKPHAEQQRFLRSQARFCVLVAGRRSGKTECAKRRLIKRALRARNNPRYFCGAPTRGQAKDIYWDDLIAMIPKKFVSGDPKASELSIKLINGAEIKVVGFDKPERFEGPRWDGGILDEYAYMKPTVWTKSVRPALSENGGWCWFVGKPSGRNHFFDRYHEALADVTGAWEAFHWLSADILPPEEIEAAKRDLDELTFQQEYEASFVNFEGMAYYPFLRETHAAAALRYCPTDPLIICLDFNTSPGVAIICQEQLLPNGVYGTGIIAEVYIPFNSNTPAVCNVLIQDWAAHEGEVVLYGDSSGGNNTTSNIMGSDWDLVLEAFKNVWPGRLSMKVPSRNPPERSRINSMNSRLASGDGRVRMMVDPNDCPNVIRDFEGVTLLKGGAGHIDKKYDLKLTHLTDGIGYYVDYEFPVAKVEDSIGSAPVFAGGAA